MPKKAVHRKRIVKKPSSKPEPVETQEEIIDENNISSGTVSQDSHPVENENIETQPASLVNQPSDVVSGVVSQAGSAFSSPQNTAQVQQSIQPEPAPSANQGDTGEKTELANSEDSWENDGESEPVVAREESKGEGGFLKTILSILKYFLIFILGVLAGGFVVYQNGGNLDFIFKKTVGRNESSQRIQAVPTVKPTEKPVDLTMYSIKVLNGSEVPGEASRLRDSLEKTGFKVSSIGNASESSFLKTVIMAKPNVNEAFLEKLKEELLKTYELDKIGELKESADDDIEIIIGAKPQ